MGAPKKDKKRTSRGIGDYFKTKRLALGVTESSAAAYLGCGIETFLQYESGGRPLPLSSAYALANFLNLDPDEVIRVMNGFLN